MFFVNDNQEARHGFIRKHLTEESASIAIILASIDFEWTLRRAILALGKNPTKCIRKNVLANLPGGYDGYKQAWRAEVQPRIGIRIDQVVRKWSKLHGKNSAEKTRGSIVHGACVPITIARARNHVENWLCASRALEELAIKIERKSLFQRIIRYKPR
jgi:hypothetical protein